jgi:hypothetical protein
LKVPTEKQFEQLGILGSGAMALAPGRRDWKPLLRRGWVQPEAEDDGNGYLPPLRITADGLRALADAVDRYGWPDIREKPKKLTEPPTVTRLKTELADERNKRTQAEREAFHHQQKLRRARRILDGAEYA